MIVTEQDIKVQLPQFDGPLALLLHLVKNEEIALRELDITQISKQYLNFLYQMKDLNFDIAGEYLYMAATLLHLKSYESVQEEEVKVDLSEFNDEDFPIQTREDLIRRLEELEKYQTLSKHLWEFSTMKDREVFTRPRINKKKLFESFLTPVDLEELTGSMMDFLFRNSRKFKMMRRDRISIKEKLISLKNTLKVGEPAYFSRLVDWEKGLDDIVITFISLLELSRLKTVILAQPEGKGEIVINVIKNLNDFNVELANGFDSEEEEHGSELENN